MRYCRHCGAPAEPEDRFCMECGKPLYNENKPAPQASRTEAFALPRPSISMPSFTPSRRMKQGLVLGAALLVVAGGGVWYWLQPPAASVQNFQPILTRYLQQHQQEFVSNYCLSGPPYDRAFIDTYQMDEDANGWMRQLVAAGLYTGPQQMGNGFFVTGLRYTQTAAGKAAIHDGKLCLADGIQITEIKQIAPPIVSGGITGSPVSYAYALTGMKPWVTPAMLNLLPQHDKKGSAQILLTLHQRTWSVPNDDEAQRFVSAGQMESLLGGGHSDESGGLLGWFKRLLPSQAPGKPEVMEALARFNPMLMLSQDELTVQSCETADEGQYRCSIIADGHHKDLMLGKDAAGNWQVR
jgi:hypothetical protein